MRALLVIVLASTSAIALKPEEIVVVVNRGVPSSVELGEYYLKARGVPKENLIALTLPRQEEMPRGDYDKHVVAPLREKLADRKDKIKCLLLIAGVPLRVGGVEPSDEEKAKGAEIQTKIDAAKAKPDADKTSIALLEAKLRTTLHKESQASVDSELIHLWQEPYELARWQANPLHWQAPEKLRKGKPPFLMTCRLDGPSNEIVKRLIDDAIAVEAKGLSGKVYVDARGFKFDATKPGEAFGYSGFDESMREMAGLFKGSVLDDKPELFAPKSCPDAALYCGWYSHARYVDCCTFVRGAVAWHLASSEAITLRDEKSQVWCPNLLKAGVAATLGPVGEPYSVAFPKPAEFFGMLATGEYTLAEVNARTTPFASWMMTCVGDPLYNPFAKNKLLRDADVIVSPKGSRPLFR